MLNMVFLFHVVEKNYIQVNPFHELAFQTGVGKTVSQIPPATCFSLTSRLILFYR